MDLDPFLPRGRHILADVVRADGELAVAAIHKHRQLDLSRPTRLDHRVDGRPNRPSVEEDVVDQQHRAPVNRRSR